MNVIDPIAVTDAMLTSSVPEDDYPLWNPGTTYVKGARVIQAGAHSVFESVVDGNLGNDPVITTPGKWIAIRATNRWAMFDDAVGSSTSATGQVVVTLMPGAPVAALGVLDTDAATVRVQIKVGGVAHHDETRHVPGDADDPASLLFLDLPMDPAAAITITLAAATPSTPVSVGTLVFGALIDLGVTEAGPSVGINDFSRRETDDFGVTTVVERAWAKRMTVRSMIATSEVDVVQRRLAALRARPSLWIGDAGFESLCIYGYFKDFSIDLALETISYCSLTIEGLTKAQELLSVESGLAAILTNEMHTLPSDSAGNVTSYAGAAGEFKIYSGTEDVSAHFELSSQDNPQGLAVVYSGQSYAITGGLDAGEPSATLTIRAMGTGPFSGLTIDKVFSLAKASAGANGEDGANGANAKTLTLLSDRQTIAYDGAGVPSPAVQTTSFSTNKQNTTATVNWSVTDANGGARTPVASYLSAATGDSVTMTEAQFAAARNGTAGVIVTASISDGGTIMDRISVVRVQAGAKGDKGDPGTAGAPGTPGANGQTLYTWVAYADSANGTVNFTTGIPGGRGFQGLAVNKTTATESTNPADYVWGAYRGPANFGLVPHANVAVGPDYIVKSGGEIAWDASAYSSEAYVGGAFCSFTVPASGETIMLGLNTDPTTDAGWESLDYALYCEPSTAALYAAESGQLHFLGTYAGGETLTVAYDGQSVRYHKNGGLLRSITAPAGLRLYLDSSLASGRISDIKFGPAGAAGAKGDKGDTGARGYDAIAYVQEGAPGAPSSSNQLWYRPSTKQFFRWNGSVWVEMLGTLSQYDQIVTSLIKVDTIHASHFITDQGVDLAALVPGTFGSMWGAVSSAALNVNNPDFGSNFSAVVPFGFFNNLTTYHRIRFKGSVGAYVSAPDFTNRIYATLNLVVSINGGAWTAVPGLAVNVNNLGNTPQYASADIAAFSPFAGNAQFGLQVFVTGKGGASIGGGSSLLGMELLEITAWK